MQSKAIRLELGVARMLLLSSAMAFATAVSAQLKVFLPFTPVPVTAQVLTVLLAGSLLGPGYGTLSQVLYIAGGSAGLPWFSSRAGILGCTGGYIIGFVAAAFLVGALTQRFERLRTFAGQMLAMLSGVMVIYFFGALHFSIFMHTGLTATLGMAVVPFIGFDLVKALVASLLSSFALGGLARSNNLK